MVAFVVVVEGDGGQFGELQSLVAQQHFIGAVNGVDALFSDPQLLTQLLTSAVQPRFVTVFVPGSIVCSL